jgi:hypothetical protein
MITAASCYRIGDRYDDVITHLEDENEPADVLWNDTWENDYLVGMDDLTIAELTQWADRYAALAYFAELSYEYVCPPDFRFAVD